MSSANAELVAVRKARTEVAALHRDERGRYVAEKAENDRKLAAEKKEVEDEIAALKAEIVTLKQEKGDVLKELNGQIDAAQKTLTGISAKIDRIKSLAG